MAYLRIVLLGVWRSGKSSAGNTILGGSVFKAWKSGQRSRQCEVRYGEVAGRHLTVVDSPGWTSHSTLQYTAEMDKLEIQDSVCLCLPGPHAALLTVALCEAFTKAERLAVEEHMSLLSQSMWSHTIVLFTHGDRLGDRSIEQHIEAGGEDLRWLVDKCGNRYHVFNNEKRDDTQVTQLLEKIEIVSGNRGGHYEVDGDVAEKLSERKRNIEEHVLTLMTKTHRQRGVLKALFEGEHQSLSDMRLMLVGGDQFARSVAGDAILQVDVFPEWQTECDKQLRLVAETNVSVVICPDWSTTPPSQKIKDLLLHGVTLCSPGPHAVLVTVPVCASFSEAHRRSVEEHMELLGDRVWKHTLVLFTVGFWLGERHVEEYIESEGEPLRRILEKCGYRYHVLDCLKFDISEVKELMEKVEDMVMRNGGHFAPSDSREDVSVRDTGHLREGQKTLFERLFERLRGKQTFTAEEWNRREEEFKKREEEGRRRREEELIERMLKFVVKEPEEPTLPAVKRRPSANSKGNVNPSMSGGTLSEAGSSYCWSPDKVHDWLLKRHAGPIAPSSGYESGSGAEWQAEQPDGRCQFDPGPPRADVDVSLSKTPNP